MMLKLLATLPRRWVFCFSDAIHNHRCRMFSYAINVQPRCHTWLLLTLEGTHDKTTIEAAIACHMDTLPLQFSYAINVQPRCHTWLLLTLEGTHDKTTIEAAIACHMDTLPLQFSYAINVQPRCHTWLLLTLEGTHDKTTIEAAIACHMDTSTWDPRFPRSRCFEGHPWYLPFSKPKEYHLGGALNLGKGNYKTKRERNYEKEAKQLAC
uniref:Seed coat BURP domain protein-like protein n=1 Tax=Beta vulgaris subsp. vulgaris TaxID=3555 RepID=J3S7L0_BETVV|nr:seed coat BURP domain protein-like protein [Beta vulgaris subsp. vulgaris]